MPDGWDTDVKTWSRIDMWVSLRLQFTILLNQFPRQKAVRFRPFQKPRKDSSGDFVVSRDPLTSKASWLEFTITLVP